MVKVVWTRAALNDVRYIRQTLARDGVPTVDDVCQRLVQSAATLAQAPRGGRRVPEFDHDQLREYFVRPDRVVYEHRESNCFVLAVLHANRDVPPSFQ
jgi:plasmid stabilization system protein ParE